MKGLNIIKKYLKQANENGIELILTLSHYDYPMRLLEKYNGFSNKKAINKFLEYIEVCLK